MCVVSKSNALLWRYSSPLFHNLKTSFIPPDEPVFILCIAFSLLKSPFMIYKSVTFHTGLFVFIVSLGKLSPALLFAVL